VLSLLLKTIKHPPRYHFAVSLELFQEKPAEKPRALYVPMQRVFPFGLREFPTPTQGTKQVKPIAKLAMASWPLLVHFLSVLLLLHEGVSL